MQLHFESENIPLVQPAEGGPGQKGSWASVAVTRRKRTWTGFIFIIFDAVCYVVCTCSCAIGYQTEIRIIMLCSPGLMEVSVLFALFARE